MLSAIQHVPLIALCNEMTPDDAEHVTRACPFAWSRCKKQ